MKDKHNSNCTAGSDYKSRKDRKVKGGRIKKIASHKSKHIFGITSPEIIIKPPEEEGRSS